MKKAVFILALVAMVIGSIYAGSALAGAKSKAGSVLMEAFAGDLVVVPAHTENVTLAELSYDGVRHFSLTVPAGNMDVWNWGRDPGWVEVLVDMDGDGACETYIAPIGMQLEYCGKHFGACYQFDAYGFLVKAFNRDPAADWPCRVNATMTCVK